MDAEEVAFRLRVAFRHVGRTAHAVSGPDGPTRSELDAMVRLDEAKGGALTPSALAAAMRVRPQTVGQTLDLLDKHRWIRRTPHPTDRRQVLISLSPAGARALAKGRAQRQAWLVGELKRLAPAELKTLDDAIAILDRIAPAEASPSLKPPPHRK